MKNANPRKNKRIKTLIGVMLPMARRIVMHVIAKHNTTTVPKLMAHRSNYNMPEDLPEKGREISA